MRFPRFLLGFVALSLAANVTRQDALPEEGCTHVSRVFPNMLRDLRAMFNRVKDYFQMKDEELDTMLLQGELLEDFKGFNGCHSVSEMVRFYMDEVLPKANGGNKDISNAVDFMGIMLAELKSVLKRCHRFLACEKKSKTIKQIKETYIKMQDKGIFKAMGEFDIFIDYIEEYLMARKKK
ncbi:interleukin-10 [Ambystoma mexicanum]|uniref:interleukin-10 n=1 Tax=Ambystoma mexicanum TaxID=8296 RepID=UPI0037E8FEE7